MPEQTKIKRNGVTPITSYNEGEKKFGIVKEFREEPLKFLSRLAKLDDDIVEFKAAALPFALVNDPEMANQILVKMQGTYTKSDRSNSILNFAFGDGVLSTPSAESHRIHRKIIMPGFQRTQLELFAEQINNLVQNYFSTIELTQPRDISRDMFRITLGIINKTLFNFDVDSQIHLSDEIGDSVQAIQEGIFKKFNQLLPRPQWLPTPTNRKLKSSKEQVSILISHLMDNRLKRKTETDRHKDMLDILLEARYENGDSLEKSQIIDELVTLIFAGHETTANSMVWTIYLLTQNPRALEQIKKEVDALGPVNFDYHNLKKLHYTEQVIKESMRIYPPVWCLGARTSRDDNIIGEYHIPKGIEMLVAPYTMHRNPIYFPDPEKFDPERFSPEAEKKLPRGAYIPFGLGPRICAGNHFAMMEAKIILANFVRQFDFSLCENQTINPRPQITLSNETGMHVEMKLRKEVERKVKVDTEELAFP